MHFDFIDKVQTMAWRLGLRADNMGLLLSLRSGNEFRTNDVYVRDARGDGVEVVISAAEHKTRRLRKPTPAKVVLTVCDMLMAD